MLKSNKQRGFTLLEVLVATTIFSLLSLASWAVLSGVLRTHERTRNADWHTRQISNVMTQLSDDINGFVPRQSRATGAVLSVADRSLTLSVRLAHSSTNDCCAPALQRVRWFLDGDTLYRAVAEYPDNPAEQTITPMISGVSALTLRYYDQGWQQPAGRNGTLFTRKSALPGGLEVSFTLADNQTLTRRFLLTGKWPDDSGTATPKSDDTQQKAPQEGTEP
ncbi:type II secretion system minor pseudopilin GspJ [Trabulsiella odontotermitis]|uniref:type II secretion system minor pseudopilin GspJ n=1 Tax=Trabulsiella odontotermitis TaxID=379893 RepID=UPI0006BA1C35|nr:type II secretion system minor pseudopilin GspJ [Trabulsiella odontotermitis]